MKVLIENQYLTVESKPTGAELTSIKLKADGTEYLWQADPKFWNRHAPLLFPIVGSVANNQYTYDGKQYTLKNHGFARDAEFEIAHESEGSVVYRLKDNAATQAAFPFRFNLEIGYTLKDNAVAVSYRVVNEDEKVMYFSIGAHPAFNCPIAAGDSFTDYYLEFSDNETLDRGYVNGPNLLIAGKTEPFFRNEKVKPMIEGMFADGAYIFDHLKSTSVALKGRKTAKSVTVSFPGFPQFGIWSMPDAPYVCIEPWYGISESTDFSGDLTQKKGVLQLQPGKEFRSEYKIIIE